MKAWQHFRALLGHEPWFVEMASAVGLLLMSVMLMLGPADLQGQHNWRYLSDLVSDETFGGITAALGAAQLAVTCVDSKWGRIIMAFAAAVFWLTLAHSLWLGNPASPGTAPFLTLGLQNLASVLLIRLRPQHQRQHRLHDV